MKIKVGLSWDVETPAQIRTLLRQLADLSIGDNILDAIVQQSGIPLPPVFSQEDIIDLITENLEAKLKEENGRRT